MSLNDFDLERAREVREKVKDSYAKEMRRLLLQSCLGMVPFALLLIYACISWALAIEPSRYLVYLTLYMLGILALMITGASYHTTARIMVLLKEIKQTRLDLCASGNLPTESATGGAESFSVWLPESIKPKTFILAVTLILSLVGVVGAVGAEKYLRYRNHSENPTMAFGGQEVADAHITADNRVRTFCRINITKCPMNIGEMHIHVPKGAKLESVTFDGRPAAAVPTQDDCEGYLVVPGMPESTLRKALLEVVWSVPIESVAGKPGWFELKSTIATNAYWANVVFDEGAKYRFSGTFADTKAGNMFWTRNNSKYWRNFGTCGADLVPVQ